MGKKYKAGQIVTIKNRRYRIVKTEAVYGYGTCTFCDMRRFHKIQTLCSPCDWCVDNLSHSLRLVPF